MANIFILTSGRSLLPPTSHTGNQSINKWRNHVRGLIDQSPPDPAAKNLLESLRRVDADSAKKWQTSGMGLLGCKGGQFPLRSIIQQHYPNSTSQQTVPKIGPSAELDSLLYPHGRHDPPKAGDRVVLMCSDTDTGVLCAVATAFALSDCVRIHRSQPAGQPAHGMNATDAHKHFGLAGPCEIDLPGGCKQSSADGPYVSVADVVVIEDLDVERAKDFEKNAGPNLLRAAAWALDDYYRGSKTIEQIHIHLAGGFKSTIPYLTLLLQFMKDIKVSDGVKAWCLFEGSKTPVAVPCPVGPHNWILHASTIPNPQGRKQLDPTKIPVEFEGVLWDYHGTPSNTTKQVSRLGEVLALLV